MSKKDAYYFPHFSNARNDRKIKRLVKELGIEGYAIYFMVLEVLRDQAGFKYPLADIDLLADEFGTSEQKVKVTVCKYDLFIVDEQNMFFSPKFIEFMTPYTEKSERARAAAIKKWDIEKQRVMIEKDANAYANAEQMQCAGNASKVKESKVKESKIDSSKASAFTPPEKKMVCDYFQELGLDSPGAEFQGSKFMDYYLSNGWIVGKTKMKDWRAAVRNWIKNMQKFNNGQSKKPSAIRGLAGFTANTNSLKSDLAQLHNGGTAGFNPEIPF